MKQQTKEIISDITQGMINANNKYYEERKIAKQEILDAIDNINHCLRYFCDDHILRGLIRGQLDTIKENLYKM